MTVATLESAGKKLHDKRLERRMTVADAARLTHIRPDRIIDLEKDDYSNFPSLAYARGFLLIYARLLTVDVADAAVRLENSNPVDIEEYEYLSGRAAPLTRSLGVGRKIVAVLAVVASILVGGTLIVVHFIANANRLDDLGLAQKDQLSLHAVPQTAAPSQNPEPVASPTAEPQSPNAEPVAAARNIPPVTSGSSSSPESVPQAADIIVVLRPIKKTWVKISTAGDDTPPVYEDWLYPDAGGLTLHGKKIWVQLSDGDGVEIKKNGQTIPYNSPGIVVQ